MVASATTGSLAGDESTWRCCCRWSQVCLLSWVDEDVVDAVEWVRQLLHTNNIVVKRLIIGQGLLAEPVQALEHASVFSYGSFHLTSSFCNTSSTNGSGSSLLQVSSIICILADQKAGVVEFFNFFSPSGSHTIWIFYTKRQAIFRRDPPPLTGTLNASGVGKTRFSYQYLASTLRPFRYNQHSAAGPWQVLTLIEVEFVDNRRRRRNVDN